MRDGPSAFEGLLGTWWESNGIYLDCQEEHWPDISRSQSLTPSYTYLHEPNGVVQVEKDLRRHRHKRADSAQATRPSVSSIKCFKQLTSFLNRVSSLRGGCCWAAPGQTKMVLTDHLCHNLQHLNKDRMSLKESWKVGFKFCVFSVCVYSCPHVREKSWSRSPITSGLATMQAVNCTRGILPPCKGHMLHCYTVHKQPANFYSHRNQRYQCL